MKPAIFPKRGSGNALSPQADLAASGTEMPASVLEPLQARSSSSSSCSSSSNPFDAYGDAPPEAPGVKPRPGALTAFAAAPESQSAGGSSRGAAAAAAASAAVLYPEGLPKFLGLLRPTITFGVGRLTLSRGMDFIAHFVAVSTLVFFVFILFAVNWMQKLCLPIVSNWTHNCTLAVGAFMALLAIFSWRSAANFDLKRSKVFLFLLGWRLHVFLLLSLLMVLGLALKPQLNAHVENSVRVCMLRQETTAAAAAAAFPFPISGVSLLPTLPLPVLNYAGPAHRAPRGVRTPESPPAAHPAAAKEQQEQQQEANKESIDGTKPLPEAAQSPGQTGGPPGAAQGQAAQPGAPAGAPSAAAGAPNSNSTERGKEEQKTENEKTQEELQHAANGPAAAAAADAPAAEETAAAAAGSEGSAGPEPAAQQEPAAAAAAAALPAAGAPAAAEAPPAAAAEAPKPAAGEAESSAAAAEAAAAAAEAQQRKEREGSGAAADAARAAAAAKVQQQMLQAAQVAAVKETNVAVVIILVVASLALVFELYLMYACWSFKVWMERGYEAVVLAGVAPFAPVDGGNGWLAYAVRMPQTVQLETYGGNAGGPGHLPVFVQTTDSSDCFANVNLPMTGRW
ncbi:hypothetical protein, conserved [Eimeria tenella]|uniref:Uncharacterized protein n=1 Tax=Eimeria tenella TaxID=5802 RepID=U6L1Z9_EIMTE|nr:hypothetical protein, conserved [Eimeria tenella]CDJ43223.1 hypothetical protein, conserved [Eimeria tenella]|eukprot:XP_013233973.1 hypothetical protein, conserved [Eimeria tenella]